jgi:hypothetical protein
LFPLSSTEFQFSEKEIIGLLEWLLPQAWRSKFDLNGYIPRLNNKPLKHCTVHDYNASHDSSECYTLKNQTKPGRQIVDAKANSSQTFTAKRFRKEVNMLAQKSSKKRSLNCMQMQSSKSRNNSKLINTV